MKKIFLLLFLTYYSYAFAQFPHDKNWDWENTDPGNWNANTQGFGKVNSIIPTWQDPDGEIQTIVNAKDYTRQNGWVLLRKDFGDVNYEVAYPYFVLYNKYKSIVRVFAFLVEPDNGYGLSVAVDHEGTSQSAVLNYTKKFALSTDKYPQASNNDLGLVKTTDIGQLQWMYADFPIAFDPNIVGGTATYLTFTISANNSATISLQGAFQYSTTKNTGIGSNAKQLSCPSCSTSTYLADGAKFLDKIPSFDSFSKTVKTISSGFPVPNNDTTSILGETKNLFKELTTDADVKELLGLTTGFGTSLTAISNLFNFFTGTTGTNSDKTTSFVPTVSHGTVQLKGSIDYAPSPLTRITQGIPNDKVLDVNNEPFFNSPMGIMAVTNTINVSSEIKQAFFNPVFVEKDIDYADYRSNTDKDKNINTTDELTLSADPGAAQPFALDEFDFPSTIPCNSYKINNIPQIALNGANDSILELVKIEGCLEGIANLKQVILKIPDVTQESGSYYPNKQYGTKALTLNDLIAMPNSISYKVHVLEEQGQSTYQPSGGYPGTYSFQISNYFNGPGSEKYIIGESPYPQDTTLTIVRTPFVNISCLKDLVLTLPQGGSLIGVKIRALFKKKDETAAPLVYMITLKADTDIVLTPFIFPLNGSQTIAENLILDSHDHHAPQFFATNTIQSSSFFNATTFPILVHAGLDIELNSGFEGFSLNGQYLDIGLEDFACDDQTKYITTIPSTNHFSAPSQSRLASSETEHTDSPKTNIIDIYPNPFNNSISFNFHLSQDANVNITLYDELMRPIEVLKNVAYSAGNYTLSKQFSGLPNGMYFVQFSAGDYKESKKIIKVY